MAEYNAMGQEVIWLPHVLNEVRVARRAVAGRVSILTDHAQFSATVQDEVGRLMTGKLPKELKHEIKTVSMLDELSGRVESLDAVTG